MRILVTGFEPFGGETINPSFEIVKRLPSSLNGAEIIKLEVPTVFHSSIGEVIKTINDINPDAVLMIGQAGGRFDISVERIGINIDDARISDNLGNTPIDEPIDPDSPAAHFASIPIKAIVQNIRNKNIPASISNTAGTFVCNHLMYGALNYINKNNLPIKAGFIHIPFLVEQVSGKSNTPSMSLDVMTTAIEAAIETIINTSSDIKLPEGKEM